MTQSLTHYIGGQRVPVDPVHSSENPSDTREIVARFPDGTAAEVDAAVRVAPLPVERASSCSCR